MKLLDRWREHLGLDRLRIDMTAALEGISLLSARTADLRDNLSRLARAPSPRPFVSLLAIGRRADGGKLGRRITMGTAKHIEESYSDTLALRPMVPMGQIDVIVFADLELVEVTGIFVGTDLVHAQLGPCPYARIASVVQPGVEIRAACCLRKRP